MHIENVLVTGGTGRLGRFVVAELKRHYRVVALDRDPATAPDLAVDVLDLPSLVAAMRGHHAVVHLAAIDAAVPAPAPPSSSTRTSEGPGTCSRPRTRRAYGTS